jgi:hypothetical protein
MSSSEVFMADAYPAGPTVALVKVVVDQPIAVSADQAQAALVDPSLYERLGRVSPIGSPEVLADERGGDTVTQRVRLRFTGQVSPLVARFVNPEHLTWVQETVTDLRSRRSQVRTVPDRYGWLLSFTGWYEIRGDGPRRCVQHFECDLRVNVPGLGRLAEKGIVAGLREHLVKEAEVIAGGP